MLRAALRFTGSSALAQEIVKETLLRAWHEFGQLESQIDSRLWLFAKMIDIWNSRRRSTQREPRMLIEDKHPEAGKTGIGWRAAGTVTIRRSIESLTDEFRTTLFLFSVDGFSCKEISKILGLPVATVIARLALARDLVKKSLPEQALGIADSFETSFQWS